MVKRKVFFGIIAVLASLISLYLFACLSVYKRLSVDGKIFIHVMDLEQSPSITPLPIFGWAEGWLWWFYGEREVLERQVKDGSSFLFLANLVDFTRTRREFVLKNWRADNFAFILLEKNSDDDTLKNYRLYASKTKNQVIYDYIDPWVEGGRRAHR